MDENILGKNIEYLRKSYGETLDELGYFLGFERNAIKGYESGSRKPTLETISKIAQYYNKTVDEILNVKLYETPAMNPQKRIYYAEISDEFLNILPLVESATANEIEQFSKGMKLLKEMLVRLRNGECVEGTVQVDMKEMMYEQRKINKSSAEKRKKFIKDLDELVNEGIRILKENEDWATLGDYYLALRYVEGMVETDFSDAMNLDIGSQMMLAFAGLGNPYALTFLKTGMKLG